jgi:hypothetical protein
MKGEKFTGMSPGKGDCGDGGGGREAENAVGRRDFAADFWAGRPGRGGDCAGGAWGLFALVLVDGLWRTAAPSRRNAITPLVENMLDRPLQLILVAPILVNGSGSRPTRSIEAMLNVVEPDRLSAGTAGAGVSVETGWRVKVTESMADRAAPAVVQPRLVRLRLAFDCRPHFFVIPESALKTASLYPSSFS